MASANIALLAALCVTILTTCFASPTSRILGGSDASTDAFPYIVSVRVDNAHVCGGSIIGSNYILTAAHCVSEMGTTPVASSRVSIRAGSTNQYAGGKLYICEAVQIHSGFGNFLNDVAVLKLTSPLVLGTRVQIIPLADAEDVADGDVVTVAGWGRAVAGSTFSPKLLHGESTVLSPSECEDSIGYGYASTLCLNNEPGLGSCNGDAGGPAVLNGKLVGISNFVIGACGTKYPDVFARVSYFANWIDSIVNAA